MTRYEDREPITVGVDGTEDGLRAVEFAAMQARELDRPIQLVHAVHTAALNPMLPLYGFDAMRESGRVCLDQAERRVRTFGSWIAVDKSMMTGSPGAVLSQLATRSAMIVVGRRNVHRMERLLTGSTSTAVAGRARCPVVSVPVGWRPGHEKLPIVVGVDGSQAGRDAVKYAFEEASRRHVPLVAVRAWAVPARWYADVPVLYDEADEWAERMQVSLAEDLAGYREDYPDVEVSRVLEQTVSPAELLCSSAAAAGLLVIGGKGHGGVPGLDLGQTARGVLAHASCPVVLVHQRDHAINDDRIQPLHGARTSS